MRPSDFTLGFNIQRNRQLKTFVVSSTHNVQAKSINWGGQKSLLACLYSGLHGVKRYVQPTGACGHNPAPHCQSRKIEKIQDEDVSTCFYNPLKPLASDFYKLTDWMRGH